MDSAGKLHAEKAIEGIKERGHTNLSGGLLAALEALYRLEKLMSIVLSLCQNINFHLVSLSHSCLGKASSQ